MEFEEVYVRNLALSTGLAYRILGDRELAEDAVQDAAIKAVKAGMKEELGNPDAWFMVIVKNTCYDQLRRHCSRPVSVEFGGEGDHEEIMERKLDHRVSASPHKAACRSELWHVIYAVIGEMKPLYRQPFELHYIHGYKVKEIAKSMDRPMGTVMAWLSRGRDDFRRSALRVGIDVMDFV